MSDETQQPSPEHFGIVPTLDGFLALAKRVEQLERRVETIGTPVETTLEHAEEPDTVGPRLDRHRAELEELKRWNNELAGFLRQHFAADPPATINPGEHL